jgi:hypothetical protein
MPVANTKSGGVLVVRDRVSVEAAMVTGTANGDAFDYIVVGADTPDVCYQPTLRGWRKRLPNGRRTHGWQSADPYPCGLHQKHLQQDTNLGL